VFAGVSNQAGLPQVPLSEIVRTSTRPCFSSSSVPFFRLSLPHTVFFLHFPLGSCACWCSRWRWPWRACPGSWTSSSSSSTQVSRRSLSPSGPIQIQCVRYAPFSFLVEHLSATPPEAKEKTKAEKQHSYSSACLLLFCKSGSQPGTLSVSAAAGLEVRRAHAAGSVKPLLSGPVRQTPRDTHTHTSRCPASALRLVSPAASGPVGPALPCPLLLPRVAWRGVVPGP
jgi:hypothetical protein